MAFNLDDAEWADQKSTDLVFGFVKEAQRLFPLGTYYTIPALVQHICLVHYFLEDCFDRKLMSESLEYEDEYNKYCIVKTNSGWGTAYVSNIVSTGKYHCNLS